MLKTADEVIGTTFIKFSLYLVIISYEISSTGMQSNDHYLLILYRQCCKFILQQWLNRLGTLFYRLYGRNKYRLSGPILRPEAYIITMPFAFSIRLSTVNPKVFSAILLVATLSNMLTVRFKVHYLVVIQNYRICK